VAVACPGSGEGVYSYINHGCDDQLTAEEVSEMVRISQVPFNQFGSSTTLSKVSFYILPNSIYRVGQKTGPQTHDHDSVNS